MKRECLFRPSGYEQYDATPEEKRAKDHCNRIWVTAKCEEWYVEYQNFNELPKIKVATHPEDNGCSKDENAQDYACDEGARSHDPRYYQAGIWSSEHDDAIKDEDQGGDHPHPRHIDIGPQCEKRSEKAEDGPANYGGATYPHDSLCRETPCVWHPMAHLDDCGLLARQSLYCSLRRRKSCW